MMASSVYLVAFPGSEDDPLFEFEAVSVVADDLVILDSITAAIPDRAITGVVGPSGAGKSTLLRLCNRLAVPAKGSVLFRGSEVGGLDPLALRRTVGMVFQRPTVFGGTVLDNLQVAAPGLDFGAYEAALEASTLDPMLLQRSAQDLSGGEAQRVCMARSLLAEPEVLLMDEPTSAVDNAARDAIERRVRALRDEGMPVVLVTHDLDQIRRLCDYALVLVSGRLAAHGRIADLLASPDNGVRDFFRSVDP
jgi:putative ABC transport system ATP-binding protein